MYKKPSLLDNRPLDYARGLMAVMKKQTAEVFEQKPKNFHPKVEVASCFLEMDGRLLLLEESLEKLEKGKWGVPAGKIEPNETPEDSARRELFEETGILVEHDSQIQSFGALYIRKPKMDYTFHLFKIHLTSLPNVHLSTEHQNYKWASLEDIEKIPLMAAAKEVLRIFRIRCQNYNRSITSRKLE